MKKLVLAMIFIALSTTLRAQNYRRAVDVDCTTADEDLIGKRFCTAIKDLIAASPRYRLTNTDELRWSLRIVSIRDNELPAFSAQSITLTFDAPDALPIFFTSYATITGTLMVEGQAKDVVASFDEEAQKVAAQLKN